MANIQFILTERISQLVFHKTFMGNALKILKQNKFRLSASIGTKSEKNISNKFYFLSTARSPLSSYVAGEPMEGDLYFTLDGNKLNQKFKGFAVDYWGPEFRKVDPTKNEMEDRVVSDKQYIDDAMSYIQDINILYGYKRTIKNVMDDKPTIKDVKLDKDALKRVQEIYSIAKKNNIPVYLYTDKEAFKSRNKNKTIDVLKVLKDEDVFKEPKIKEYAGRGRDNYFSDWMELLHFPLAKYNVKDYDDYRKRIRDLLTKGSDRLLFDYILYRTEDGIKRLNNDIHNSKTKEGIGKFIDAMKKLKLKDAKDVVEYIKTKWEIIK